MSEAVIRKIFTDHAEAVRSLEGSVAVLEHMAEVLSGALRAGGKVLVFGNGGSAADAQHIAGELLGRFVRERRALGAVALSTDSSTLTAIGNDYGFDRVFARQVEGLAEAGDVVWGLSTSGNSANVVLGLEAGRARGAKTIAFSGGDGGRMAQVADLCLVVKAKGTARTQEAQELAYHVLCELVDSALADEAGS